MENKLTEPMTWDINLASRMHGSGMKFNQIAAIFGLSPDTVHCRLDPEYRRKRAQAKRPPYQSAVHAFHNYVDRVKDADVAARLAEMPEDNRDLTARAFGDPVFSRSAAAQKSKAVASNGVTLPFVSILAASKQEGQNR